MRLESDMVLPEDFITFRGHENVLSLHRNTIEITKEKDISRRADCIIGVSASKACSHLDEKLKEHIRQGGFLRFEIVVGKSSFVFSGRGNKSLELTDEHELVLRRSDYYSARTAAIRCDAAACDIPRSIVRLLQTPQSEGILRITAQPSREETFNWNLP